VDEIVKSRTILVHFIVIKRHYLQEFTILHSTIQNTNNGSTIPGGKPMHHPLRSSKHYNLVGCISLCGNCHTISYKTVIKVWSSLFMTIKGLLTIYNSYSSCFTDPKPLWLMLMMPLICLPSLGLSFSFNFYLI